jgi:hypothetical protein
VKRDGGQGEVVVPLLRMRKLLSEPVGPVGSVVGGPQG